MRKHSLAQALKVANIHNEEYFTNGHFMLKKSLLNNTELKRINKVGQDVEKLKGMMEGTIKPIQQDLDHYKSLTEFKPNRVMGIEDVTDRKHAKILVDDATGIALNEYYYNFIVKVKNCTLHAGEGIYKPLTVINKQGELVGILLPLRLEPGAAKGMNYQDYMEALERLKLEKKKAKDNK